MLGWMILPFKRYVDFLGRSRRREFWLFIALIWLVYAVLLFAFIGSGFSLDMLIDSGDRGLSSVLPVVFGGAGSLLGLWWLVTLVPTLAVTVRRLHDRNLSGWWLLGAWIASIIPLVNFAAWIVMLVLLLLPGNEGLNAYGPDPKDPAGADIFA